ncbi:hypothetical protein [Cyclobacterium jeungdonense]|uniref:Uncharacterized protein n=1 Tax=Cyclobacterium jeungdonense TaxID=708087 RepID=A0ABT8C5C4_9BACT|nr:hypothetical protein [Cyclobacterium jeungdonense]MDN3687572.1 hypothetical protein [Cyclobacterium jeungdonense]
MRSPKLNIRCHSTWTTGLFLGFGMLVYFYSIGAFNTSFFDIPSDPGYGVTKISQVNSDQFPFQVPDNGDPLSGEEDQRESPDEKEWDDTDRLLANQALFVQENKLSWLFFKQLESGFYNRRKVSLFVLYHSWKTFLS